MKHTALATVPAYRPIPKVGAGSPANDTQLSNAHALYIHTGVDYPVSGDETLRHSGYGGIRQRHINLWESIERHSILASV